MIRSLVICLCLAVCCGATTSTVPSFSAPGVDDVMDLHGDLRNARLVLFVGGNQWMAMPAILGAFLRQYPQAAPVYYETLPPGLLAKQLASGSLQVGSLTIATAPDVFMAGERRMEDVVRAGFVRAPSAYATNVLAILVRRGNPKHVAGMADLGRADVRVAMPNAVHEGVAQQIDIALSKAGGQRLVDAVTVTKVRDGTTLLTAIHHRQTPLWLEQDRADAGPVWLTEAVNQERIGAPLQIVRVPPSSNVSATYQAAVVARAPHPQMAAAFVRFLEGPQARAILRSYGFGSPQDH